MKLAGPVTPLVDPPPLIDPRTGLADWSLRNAIARHVNQVMHYCNGEVRWAASEMGINATTLWRWQRGKDPLGRGTKRVAA